MIEPPEPPAPPPESAETIPVRKPAPRDARTMNVLERVLGDDVPEEVPVRTPSRRRPGLVDR